MEFIVRSVGENTSYRTSGGVFVGAETWARKGRYKEAERLLRHALERGECTAAEALELEARMQAQQGLHERAEASWFEAIQADPSRRRTVGDAISRLRRSRKDWVLRSTALLSLTVGSALLWLVFNVGTELRGRQEALDHSLGVVRTQLVTVEAGSKSLAEAIGSNQSRLNEGVSRMGLELSGGAKAADVAASFDQINERLSKFEREFSEALKALATAQDNSEQIKTLAAAIEAVGTRMSLEVAVVADVTRAVEKRMDEITKSVEKLSPTGNGEDSGETTR